MADDVTTNIAKTVEDLNDLVAKSDDAMAFLEKLNVKTDTLNTTYEKTSKVLTEAGAALVDTNTYLKEVDNTTMIGSKSLDSFANSIKFVGNNISGMLKNIPGVGNVVGEIFGKLSTNVADNVTLLGKYENKLLSLSGTAAGFGQEGSRLDFIKNSSDEVGRFIKTQGELAIALGVSKSEMTENAFAIMQIPGAYKATMDVGGQFGGNISLIEAAMLSARGTTGDYKDALEAIDFTYKQFGKTGEDSIRILTATYDVSQKLGVKFGDLERPIQDISARFAFFGDNTKSAINLVNNLGSALKNTGLGIAPTMDIISGITNQIQGLSLAQKAFLSQRSGGAGGLRGALQIEEMLESGNLEEVYKKMKDTLVQQFGGNIVTRKEGASNDASAAQYTRQVQYLMEGPFGSLVRDSAQAAKLLEAFKSENYSDITQTSTVNALEAGKAIQEKQESPFNAVTVQAQTGIELAKIQQATETRDLIGQGNDYLKQINDSMTRMSSQLSKGLISGDISYKGNETESTDLLKQSFQNATNTSFAALKNTIQTTQGKLELKNDITEATNQNIQKKEGIINTPSGQITQSEFDKINYKPDLGSIKVQPFEITVNLRYPDGKSDKQIVTATAGQQ